MSEAHDLESKIAGEKIFQKQTKTFYTSRSVQYGTEIWDSLLNRDARCFKSTKANYSFKNSLQTDGVSVSLVLQRNDLVGKKYSTIQLHTEEKYLDDLTDADIEELNLKDRTLVGIDPNKYAPIVAVTEKSANELKEEGITINATTRPRKPSGRVIKNRRNHRTPKPEVQISEDVKLREKDKFKKFVYTQGERNYLS
ncbi:hypothetical protein GEMRC1_011757 [Eukaryota sp. GEM-RC1]